MQRPSPVPLPRPKGVPCALLALVTAALGGCSSGIYPVHGRIVYADGQPAREASRGWILFTSEVLKSSASGLIQEDGSFQLTTKKLNDGALPGRYQVAISPFQPDWEAPEHVKEYNRMAQEFGTPFLDPAYADPKTSKLEAVVEPKTNYLTLTIQRAKKTKGHAPAASTRR